MPNTIFGKYLDLDSAAERGESLMRMISRDIRDRRAHMSKREYTRNVYYGNMDRKLRYNGQSNIHLPVLAEKIEGIVPKINNAFWNAEPHVNTARIRDEKNPDDTKAVEKFMNWAVEIDIPGLYDTMDMWHRNALLDTTSTLKTFYNIEERNTVISKSAKIWWIAGEIDHIGSIIPADRMKTPYEILIDILPQQFVLTSMKKGDKVVKVPNGAFKDYPVLDDLTFRVDFVDQRKDYTNVLVEFHESRFNDEIDALIYRTVTHKDRVEVEVVEYEDLIVPYRAQCLQTAERVAHQYWLTFAEIKQKIANGEWQLSKVDLEALETRATLTERHEEHEENTSMKRQKDMVVGEIGRTPSGADKTAAYSDDKILVFEVYARDDIDGDGIFEEVIYQIPYATKHIVQAQYLEEVFPHGRRPFSTIHSIRVSDRFYGISLGELLTPINVEVNAILNLVNEAQEIINNPFFFYVPSGLAADPKVITNMRPGRGIPVADINSVLFPKFMQEPLANLQAMDSLLLFADRLTISPQSVGSSQSRNAPRTARGTLALLSEGGVRIDNMIIAAQKGGWRELMYQIHALYASFGPDEIYFKVTGEERERKIQREELQGRFEFTFSGNSVNTNREVMRIIAQTRYQMLASNPLYMMDMRAMRELLADLLRWWGEGANTELLLPQLPDSVGMHPPLDQATETEMILRGQHVAVLPTDNHTEHMQHVTQTMSNRMSDNLEKWQVAWLAAHMNEHARMLMTQPELAQTSAANQANNVAGVGGGGSADGGVQ